MYPDPLIEYFEKAGLQMKKFNSSMSFSVSSNTGNKGCEWSSNNLAGLFAQKQNLVNPFFSQMNRELARFKDDVVRCGCNFPFFPLNASSVSCMPHWKSFLCFGWLISDLIFTCLQVSLEHAP
jgi:hypothetical protein